MGISPRWVAQPAAALGVGLGVGVDHLDIGPLPGLGHQVVGDLQKDFAADLHRGVGKQVQGDVDDAFGGILDGHHPVLVLALLHFGEDLLDGGHGAEAGGPAELFQGRQVGEGGLGPQERHPEGNLDLPGGGDDLPEDVAQGRGAQGAGIQVHEVGQDFLFPLEIQGAPAFLVLDAADGLGQGLAPVQQVQEFLVQGVDLLAGWLLFRSWSFLQDGFLDFVAEVAARLFQGHQHLIPRL